MIEAIGLAELDSIAAGIEVADAMVKMAPVEFLDAFMVTPGKFVVLVAGDPSSVQSSLAAGLAVAGSALVDSLEIPFLHPGVLPAIRNTVQLESGLALGLVETSSVAAGIRAADDAAKGATVQLVHLHLGRGIGGKSMLLLSGKLPEVQAGVESGSRRAEQAGRLIATRVIPQPHPDLTAQLRAGLRRLAVREYPQPRTAPPPEEA
jgi:microcompartment protein CcmL/EutN